MAFAFGAGLVTFFVGFDATFFWGFGAGFAFLAADFFAFGGAFFPVTFAINFSRWSLAVKWMAQYSDGAATRLENPGRGKPAVYGDDLSDVAAISSFNTPRRRSASDRISASSGPSTITRTLFSVPE